jgi:hypothetical protein
MGRQEKCFEYSIPNELFPCFRSFLDIFKGRAFYSQKFDLKQVLALIDLLSLKGLFQFISDKHPQPKTLSDSMKFLLLPSSNRFDQKYDQSITILIQNFAQLSFDDLNQLPNSVLIRIFSSTDLIVEDENTLFKLIIQLIEANPERRSLL